jgi:hypothetical protein
LSAKNKRDPQYLRFLTPSEIEEMNKTIKEKDAKLVENIKILKKIERKITEKKMPPSNTAFTREITFVPLVLTGTPFGETPNLPTGMIMADLDAPLQEPAILEQPELPLKEDPEEQTEDTREIQLFNEVKHWFENEKMDLNDMFTQYEKISQIVARKKRM